MLTCLLKRVLPFTLTFIIGATVGGLFHLFGSGETKAVRFTQHLPYLEGRGCRAYRRDLVAETKPLLITFKPDAMWPVNNSLRRGTDVRVLALVTFGADGKVQGVESGRLLSACGKSIVDDVSGQYWEAVKRAAMQIQFEPETVNGMPVTVTRDVEIRVTLN